MALNKQSLNINFSQGLDTKSDPFQVFPGKFLTLENTVFTKQGLLQKRNGYGSLPSLPDSTSTFLTTFNGNLTAIGNNLRAFSQGSENWVNKGPLEPLKLSVLPLIRSNTNQSQSDAVVAPNGLICTVFTDNIPNGMSTTPVYKYVIADSVTGQNIVSPTPIPVTVGTVTGSARVFLLGKYFIIVFTNFTNPTYHLQYIAINYNMPTVMTVNTDISTAYSPSPGLNFDGIVMNNALYLAWNGNASGGSIHVNKLDSTLTLFTPNVFLGKRATLMSVTADTGNSVVYASFYDSASQNGYTLAVDSNLATVLSPTQTITGEVVANITSTASQSILSLFYEITNSYVYDPSIATNYIKKNTITQSGTLGTDAVLKRSVGLASKAFIINSNSYFLTIYSSSFQPTYFMLDGSGNIVSKLAYSNAGTYYTLGLPGATVTSNIVQIPYLIKDQIQAVNKSQGTTNTVGVYGQLGINLANFEIGVSRISAAEIGNDLHISGGLLWMYDGCCPTESGFNLWPDYIEVSTIPTGGNIAAQQYFYQVTYEWTDNQGNIFRSAPSVPVSITTTGSTSRNAVNIPTLRLTSKLSNPVKLVVYRWSTAQQVYYQVTSVLAPLLNDTTVDSLTFIDSKSDADILGNNIIYTTGGVLENIGPPACSVMTLFNNRLFLVDSENENLLWFSKQVIQSVPVEMSDLLTIYIAPTVSVLGSTGPVKAMAVLDDKLILFKKEAIYYINGSGPDNTGANNQYSEPTFITSTIGCDNQQSIVFTPNGLLFQSDKGIWLLGRDLSTTYLGAPVELYTQNALVQSAVNVPGTNQVRFTLDSGITLMYDYYYGQWGTFTHVPAISSTLYQNLHTYINSSGQAFQETVGSYLDGPNPVLIKFTTSWLNLAGLQGFERAYYFYMLGVYYSPHKLNVEIAYDYNSSPTQAILITPDNYSTNYGSDPLWGSTPYWGGQSNIEQWRVFLQQQKCQSFQITIREIFDSTIGAPAGAGLSISGLDVVVGLKGSYPRLKPSRSAG